MNSAVIRKFTSASAMLVFFLPLACSGISTLQREDGEAIKKNIRRFQSQNWEERRSSVQELSSYEISIENSFYPETENIRYLALDDSHSLVRIEALRSIKKIPAGRIRNRISEIAEHEANVNIRWHALKTLSGFRDQRSAAVFIKGISDDDWLIREESIRGLLLIEDPAVKQQSIGSILSALEDRNVNVRIATLENLSIRDPRLYNALARMLNAEQPERHSMLRAILRAVQGYVLDQETSRKISELLLHPNTEVRVLALRVLKASEEASSKQKKS